MMPGIVEFDPGRRDSHPFQPKSHGDRSVHRRAVPRSDDVHLGIRGRRRAFLRQGGSRDQGNAHGENESIHGWFLRWRTVAASYSCKAAYRTTPAKVKHNTTTYTAKSATALTSGPVQLLPKTRFIASTVYSAANHGNSKPKLSSLARIDQARAASDARTATVISEKKKACRCRKNSRCSAY